MYKIKPMNDPISYQIIAAAYKVHRTLGSGFLEKIYQNALLLELKDAGLIAESEKPIKVRYRNWEVGLFYADILVNDSIIIELKAVSHVLPEHEAQLVNYLTATNHETGLLINFCASGVQVKRKFRTYKPK